MTTMMSYSGESQLSCRHERQSISSVIRLYPLKNYSVRNDDYEEPPRMSEYKQFLKLREEYENSGMVRTVKAVLLSHQHSIIHVLLLKNTSGLISSKLPGGKLEYDEDETIGMKRLMTQIVESDDDVDSICKIQHVANWWRPNFEAPIYPYIPSHITKPKEVIKIFSVELPKRAIITVAKNNVLVAAPLFEIYRNVNHYGPIIAYLPHVLGRFNYLYNP
ncbi:Cleavage and polyadenylation specificity factor subunit [Dirofilaria immitis]